MAKQTGPVKITGTIGNICFYEMDGEYYARLKSSLTGKRVKKDPRFRRTMEYAGMLKLASGIASRCYKRLPEKVYAMYREMVGKAMQLLKQGMKEEAIVLRLLPAEKIAIARPGMEVNGRGQLIFNLSSSEMNTVRLKTGQPGRQSPLIINTISTGLIRAGSLCGYSAKERSGHP